MISREIRWYIAGPMSGVPQYNIPQFDTAAQWLRNNGLTVVSPSELDKSEVREACLASPTGHSVEGLFGSWADFLSRDVKLIADNIGGIIFLRGWERSRGARLEAFVGLLCGHQFARFYDGFQDWTPGLEYKSGPVVRPLHAESVRTKLRENIP